MSTKVYEAWRTAKAIDTFELSKLLRGAIVPEIEAAIKHQVKVFKDNPIKEFLEFYEETMGYAPSYFGKDGKMTPVQYSDLLRELYKKDVNNPYQSVWDLNLSFTIRKLGNHQYVLPYYGSFYNVYKRGMVSKAVNKIEQLEDYSYWNNTDEPEGMDMAEWKARGKIWDELDKNWKEYLTVEIMTPNSFSSLCPIIKTAYGIK